MTAGTPYQRQASGSTEFNLLSFVFNQLLRGIATATIVRVEACTNSGGITPAGFVDVTPLVNQIDGRGQPIPHKTIYGLPYQRIQGGTNAVIIDPQPGDLGIAVFASRDISVVKKTKAQANPGSARTFAYSDGIYVGGLLNGVPTQYVAFDAAGMRLVSPTRIDIDAPVVNISGGGTIIDGKPFLPHTHPDPQGGNTGPVN